MQYKIFQYFMPGSDSLEELNAFLRSHRISSIEKHFTTETSRSLLIFVVEYVDSLDPPSAFHAKGSKTDYRRELSPEQYEVFSRLRDIRKEIAEKEGVPLYNIFTNAQLAEVVLRNCVTLEDLRAIPGLGHSRIEKYGTTLVGIVEDAKLMGARPDEIRPSSL
jgi:superfamily II DNA helicase RecQ